MRHWSRVLAGAVVAVGLWLQGCASTASLPAPPLLTFTDAERYGQRPAIPQPADILTLTPEQQAAFLQHLNDPYYEFIPLHRRVADYLENFTSGFNYQGDTLTAAEAFAINGGNCMSLALMTTALADLAGVRIGYQLLDDLPVYEVHGTVVEKGFHVRSILYAPADDSDGDRLFSAGLRVDYFPTGHQRFVANLTRDSFLAIYYRNVAADAITTQDYDKAYWYLRESLQYAGNDSQAINMLAVVSRHTGDSPRAEALYRYGLANSTEKLTLLKNYHVLLLTEGRVVEAEQVRRQLDNMEDPSPFHWFQLARDAFNEGDYRDAIRFYRRALALAPYMHEAYLGVAQAQYQLGDDNNAVTSLQKALENVYRPSTRKLYKAKLYSMMQAER